MKKLLSVSLASLFSISLFFIFINKNSVADQEGYVLQEEYVPNEVLVKFKKDVSVYFIQEAIEYVQGEIITYLGKEISPFQWNPADLSLVSFRLDPDLLQIKVPEIIGTEEAIDVLNLNPNVEYAEKNFICHFDKTPNDDRFTEQWGLDNTGQTGGTPDADIDAPEAWDIFTGSSNIVVAVIDTGVDYEHDDLEANIWINEDEIPGNGIDDDNNGYADDIHGYDFFDDDEDPLPYAGDKSCDHGTHVAGIIGADTNNNNLGVAGINWDIQIMVLRVGDKDGIELAAAIQAIDYATENGAYLSNNSWGLDSYSPSLFFAIYRAFQAGSLFIASAGNDNVNTDYDYHYPSCYPIDNIISVAATNHEDELATFGGGKASNWGIQTVDLGAPGGSGIYPLYPETTEILSTILYESFGYKNGTSMAAPHVAGVTALIWGDRPNLSWWQVNNIIMNSVDPKSSLTGKVRTGGRLNAYKALIETAPNLPAAPSNLRAYGDCFKIKLTWQDNSSNEQGFKIYRKSGPIFFWYIGQVGPNVTTYWDLELPPNQLFNYQVRAYNQDGNSYHSNVDGDRTLPLKECDEWW